MILTLYFHFIPAAFPPNEKVQERVNVLYVVYVYNMAVVMQ